MNSRCQCNRFVFFVFIYIACIGR